MPRAVRRPQGFISGTHLELKNHFELFIHILPCYVPKTNNQIIFNPLIHIKQSDEERRQLHKMGPPYTDNWRARFHAFSEFEEADIVQWGNRHGPAPAQNRQNEAASGITKLDHTTERK